MRGGGIARRILASIVQVREGESAIALLMFTYSFLAMTAYNIVKPVTRSKFIADLGADNLPYVQLAAGALIGVAMHLYGWTFSRLPRLWALPITQAGLAVLLVAFWALLDLDTVWDSVAFYFLGLILGILLISQFWTLANEVFDARQAKRLFGFIGGGSSLGGVTGAGLTSLAVKEVGTQNLLPVSAAILLVCSAVVVVILHRREAVGVLSGEAEGVGTTEALRLLGESRHLQLIALVIGFAAVGAAIIEQQLNMAAEAFKGRDATDEITGFLAQVTFYLSAVGFLVQVFLTSRIHRRLGIGFALLVLPASLGATGLLMLFNAALWAPALARILDSALRYTVDKTTREILFLPLPAELKERAKPFVDVTVDRVAKGLGALLVLLLIKPWGLGFTWQQVSYASLAITGLWMLAAARARREYLAVFRASLERRELHAEDVRLNLADLSTVETLVEELADPDEARVLNAIDLLEALDKRNLVTPLLLRHESPLVKARALRALESARPELAERLVPVIESMLKDDSVEVRGAAIHALHVILRGSAADLLRPHLADQDPRVAVAAAVALGEGHSEEDRAAAEATLRRLAVDLRAAAAPARREVARGIGILGSPRLGDLLVQLMGDASVDVARESIRSVERIGAADPVFVPALVSLLRRPLKTEARDVLVAYGEPIVGALAHFLQDPVEDPWVRRHIPGTLALIPCQASMDALARALGDADAFLRHKAVDAMGRLRREHPDLVVDPRGLEELVLGEARRCLSWLSLLHNVTRAGDVAADSLVARTLRERLSRGLDRIYRLLALIYPATAVIAARAGIERGDARARASAIEYLDSLLPGTLRRWLLPLIEEAPPEERARQANALLRTRVRDLEDSLTQLIHDDDAILAAAAILLVERLELWELAEDLEYVLAHRSADDWQAFEAASWVLAAHRISAETRRALWTGPLPAVVLADRLRGTPLLGRASVDELLRIAAAGRQVRLEAGRVLCRRGAVPAAVQLLLEGRVVEGDGEGADRVRDAPSSLALIEALRGSPVAATVVARESAFCLVLDAAPLLGMLADNIELAQGLFRTLLAEARPGGSATLLRCRTRPAPVTAALTPLEKVRRLGACPLFARASAEQLLELAPLARELPLTPGATLFEAGDEPVAIMVLEGAIRLSGEPFEGEPVAAPGDTIGALETLAGVRVARRAVVSEAGRALRLDREDLLDLLEGRVDLLQGLFAALLSEHGRPGVTAAPGVGFEFLARPEEAR